jgi:hypothetical protein
MNLYSFNSLNLLNWITAFAIFEIPMAFFYLSIAGKNSKVKNWYSGKHINIWNVIAQDSLYVICGIILSLRLFNYLVSIKLIPQLFIYFILCFLIIQLMGDSIFALIIKSWPKQYSTYWINYFKDYINNSGFNALIGDSLYIIAWSLSFYFVANYIKSFDTKIFIICLFLFLTSAYSVQKSN